jgi:hypothetical protein
MKEEITKIQNVTKAFIFVQKIFTFMCMTGLTVGENEHDTICKITQITI